MGTPPLIKTLPTTLAVFLTPRTLKSTANRAALGDTFNFRLPSSWQSGNIVLGGYAANSTTFTFTSGTKMIQFVNAGPLRVTIVPIDYTCNSGGSGTTRPAAPYGYLTDVTYRMYPVPSILTTTHAALPYSGPCYNSVPNPTADDWSNILDIVTSAWGVDGYPDSYYYGLLHIYCDKGCISGMGWIGLKAATGFDGFGTTHSSASETHAHEVGHNHRRWHAPGCGASGADSAFPYVSNSKSYIGNSAHSNYGFDIKTQAIYPYATYYDIMGYCRPQWISDYTYKALLAYGQAQRALESDTVQSNRALLVSGRIDPVNGQVTFRPAYILDTPSGAQLPDPGDYVIESLDADGRSLSAYPFAPTQAHADPFGGGAAGVEALLRAEAAEIAGFHLAVPYAEGTTSIRVRRGGAILGQLEASMHGPSLEAGVSALDADSRAMRVNWQGRAAEGVSLRYLVRASTDGGATWQTSGVDLSDPSIDLSLDDFGGQSVLVQVLASDGLRTASLRLGPFTVPQATAASP